MAGHNRTIAEAHSNQDELLQSMLGEGSIPGQPLPAQNGFHPAGKQSSASSRERERAFSAAQDAGSSEPGSASIGRVPPDVSTLKHQQYLEAVIKEMQADHKDKVIPISMVPDSTESVYRAASVLWH